MATTSPGNQSPQVFTSTRNRVLGGLFLAAAILLCIVMLLPGIGGGGIAIAAIVSVWLGWIGFRLIVTSKLNVTIGYIEARNRWGRTSRIERSGIERVELGTRNVFYERAFPRLVLKSGGVVDLLFFEQPARNAQLSDSTVNRVLDALRDEPAAGSGPV